jgi:ribosomal protein S18 acetylase RimI-like enzyme
MRQWPNDPTVAHLIFLDHLSVPSASCFEDAIAHAGRRGARAIRTSAMFPRAGAVALELGFRPIDELALLRLALRDGFPLPWPGRRTTALRPWHARAAAAVDVAAFGPLWGNDPGSLRDIRRATPHHRARGIRAEHRLAGIALSGGAGDTGYLQRLAVHDDFRRRGIARDLVLDALGWMRSSGFELALVNTGTTNHGALALYEGLGFVRLADHLTIAELPLRA